MGAKVDDGFLIQQTLNGNKNAFRFLVLRYQRPIFKILGTVLFDPRLVEDVAQETFLRAYRSLSSFDPALGASFSTWVITIARNLAFNELDKRKVRLTKADTVEDQPSPSEGGPEQNLAAKQSSHLIRQAIEKLPRDFRLAVVLSCLEGHTIAEIAAIEACSEGTVKSRIFRGKQMLRGFLLPIMGEGYGKNL